jgi:hypothetical protein
MLSPSLPSENLDNKSASLYTFMTSSAGEPGRLRKPPNSRFIEISEVQALLAVRPAISMIFL